MDRKSASHLGVWGMILVVMMVGMSLALAGCGSSGSASSGPDASGALGSVKLTVTRDATRSERSVPSSTTAIRVSVLGTTVASTTAFPPGASTLTVTLSSVPIGQQTVLVEALNGTQVVASGQSVVAVLANESIAVTITLSPVTLTVTSVTPSGGPVTGSTVTITGTNFATSGTVTVKFGTGLATHVSVTSTTSLSCTTPRGAAGVVDVTVINPDQTSAVLAGGYTYFVNTAVIMTVAGTGTAAFSGDGGPATAAEVNFPYDVAVDSGGNLIFVDTHNYRLRKIDANTGLISTIAGTGVAAATGDGGPATAAAVNPVAMALGPGGDIYEMDSGTSTERLLREISAATGNISLVKSLTGTATNLLGFTVDSAETVYMSKWNSPGAVLKMDSAGVVTTVNTGLSAVRSVALSPDETQLYASNQNNFDIPTEGHKVKRITLASGGLADFAGTGTQGFSGDGGPATAAQLDTPWFVCTDTAGNVYICDRGNSRIRVVSAATGFISTIVGNGNTVGPGEAPNPRGDGGPPLSATLGPLGAVCVRNGDLYFSEVDTNKVRRVTYGPYLSGVSPPSGSGGTTVTLTGANFKPGVTVTFGGTAATQVQIVSSTQLVCTVPAGAGAATIVPVSAQNPGAPKTVLARAFTLMP